MFQGASWSFLLELNHVAPFLVRQNKKGVASQLCLSFRSCSPNNFFPIRRQTTTLLHSLGKKQLLRKTWALCPCQKIGNDKTQETEVRSDSVHHGLVQCGHIGHMTSCFCLLIKQECLANSQATWNMLRMHWSAPCQGGPLGCDLPLTRSCD